MIVGAVFSFTRSLSDAPRVEDIKKLERRVKREEKKLAEQSGKLTNE